MIPHLMFLRLQRDGLGVPPEGQAELWGSESRPLPQHIRSGDVYYFDCSTVTFLEQRSASTSRPPCCVPHVLQRHRDAAAGSLCVFLLFLL